jgi:hypothetical protein
MCLRGPFVSLCSDPVLAEWCICLTDCVTMGDRFGGGRGFLRPWGSVTVHRRPVLHLVASRLEADSELPAGLSREQHIVWLSLKPAHCLAKFEARKRFMTRKL